jgi:light-regulated signal transduction histidine kinase (bacteriophytochrome)
LPGALTPDKPPQKLEARAGCKRCILTIAIALPRSGIRRSANLISNAIKHQGKSSGRVKIDAIDRGKFYEFTVQDDGVGIPSQFHDKILGIFQT